MISSNISDTVVFYDSIYKAPHRQEVKNLLFLFYKNFVVDNELVIKYANVMKQVGSNGCGLFCIAYSVNLAEGNNPSDIEYNQSCMRWHLVQCFKKGKLALSPKKFKESQQQKRYISRNYSCCQPIVLLVGSYFLVKAQVMKDRKIFQ